jgi:hypothetical protein
MGTPDPNHKKEVTMDQVEVYFHSQQPYSHVTETDLEQ